MATEIVQINIEDFSPQTYGGSDINLMNPIEVDTFLSSSSYIEYFIYDNNQNVLNSTYNFTNYSVQNNGQSAGNGGNISQIILDPEASLIEYGYNQGEYISYYNILNKQIGSNLQQLYITEISSDRTELRLDSTSLTDIDIVEQTNNLIQQRSDSPYFLDFYLNFGENILSIANNIQLDNLDPTNPTILIKLYEALPDQFDINDTLWIVTLIDEPLAYQVTFEDPIFVVNDTVQISGPNFNLDLKNQVNNSTGALSYSDLISTPLTSSLNQLNSLLEEKEIDINIDYTDFNDFIHFSSAQTRLENFYYKVSLIEQYSSSLSTLSLISNPSSTVLNDQTSYENKINDLITNFDGYEYYLYFESSSYAWPKSNTEKPYLLFTTSSTEVIDWLGSTNEYSPIYGGMYLSSSIFDENNKDNLLFTIPEYLREDSENNQYSLFVEMVAQHYDNIWIYYKDVTQKYNADNRLENGISKDIVADAIRDFGIKLYQNNFSNEDLYTAFLGLTPEGALFPFPNITGSLPTPSGYEYVDTLISASNDYMPLDDVNKSLYKRIYHNLPYLLKSKGTIPGLRALITSYGIPDTILRINEYGGKDKVNTNDWDYWQNESNYSYYNSGSNTIETPWVLNPSWNSPDDVPSTLEFRFKIKDLELVSGSSPQTLWENENSTTLQINYTGSGYSSGSYSGSIIDPTYQYAELNLYPDLLGSPNISASIYLPICDENWWSVMITRDNDDFTLYSGNKIYEGGNNGTTLGFFQSSSVNLSTVSWVNSTTSTFMSSVDGYLQEIRYYTTVLNENVFKDYIMNPYSIEGNSINSTPNELAFRAALGGELYTSSISIHPKITGSWDVTSSFTSDSDFIYVGTPIFNSNEEYFFYDQPVVGIKNAVSDKIRLENSVIPEGNTLSPLRSLSQNLAASQSYTINTNLLEVAFSPQDEINDDINSSIGFFNIGDYIGDPSLRSSPDTSYPALDKLRNDYFEKYTKNYKLNDFIRLIKFFDNSLFKMIKDFVPARTSLASGIIIKQHLLERNKYPQPQMIWESLDILGTLKPQWNNYNEGTVENFSGGTGGQLEKFNSVSNVSQSWNVINQTSLGIITTLHDSQDEFYNGEFSGSVLTVTTQSLNQPYPNSNPSFFYTPVIYSNDNYSEFNYSQFTETQFLNTSTIPTSGEILILKPWESTSSHHGIITTYYGDSYLKVHKLDNNGVNNTIILGQINNLLIKYSSLPTATTFNILEKTEYSNYYLFKVNNTTLVDDYIKDYTISGSITLPQIIYAYTDNPILYTASIDIQNAYTPIPNGIFKFPQTPNIKLDYTSSITLNSAVLVSGIEFSFGPNTKIFNVNGPTTIVISGSIYPLSNQIFNNFLINESAQNLTLSDFQFSLTQSINSSSAEIDTVIFEPYITTVNYYNSDLNPIINNAVDARQSTIWDDLDYTQGDLKPVNFGIILSGSADKAYVQDSNYTLKRHTSPRYEGSRSTSQRLNTWSLPNTIPGYSDIGTYGKLPTIEDNTTTILEFEYGGGFYPEIASAGGFKISQMLNVNSTSSVDKFQPSLEYFTDVLEKTFLQNTKPLIKQYTTNSPNTSGAKVLSTMIGPPRNPGTGGNQTLMVVSSNPTTYLTSYDGDHLAFPLPNLSILPRVSIDINGRYATGPTESFDTIPFISSSIANGDEWYATIYNSLPTPVNGLLEPFNSGSLQDYTILDDDGNYIYPLAKNGVYKITEASGGSLLVTPPLPEVLFDIGGGNADSKGCIIWRTTPEPMVLLNDATLSGVGKGCLVPPNASNIINNNLEYITKTYGINN